MNKLFKKIWQNVFKSSKEFNKERESDPSIPASIDPRKPTTRKSIANDEPPTEAMETKQDQMEPENYDNKKVSNSECDLINETLLNGGSKLSNSDEDSQPTSSKIGTYNNFEINTNSRKINSNIITTRKFKDCASRSQKDKLAVILENDELLAIDKSSSKLAQIGTMVSSVQNNHSNLTDSIVEVGSCSQTADDIFAEFVSYCEQNNVDIGTHVIYQPSETKNQSLRVSKFSEIEENAIENSFRNDDTITSMVQNSPSSLNRMNNDVLKMQNEIDQPILTTKFTIEFDKSSHLEKSYCFGPTLSEDLLLEECQSFLSEMDNAEEDSCSSGSDSGRGDSETSCPTPERLSQSISGGSDDGLWSIEDIHNDMDELSDTSSDYKTLPLTATFTAFNQQSLSVVTRNNRSCSSHDTMNLISSCNTMSVGSNDKYLGSEIPEKQDLFYGVASLGNEVYLNSTGNEIKDPSDENHLQSNNRNERDDELLFIIEDFDDMQIADIDPCYIQKNKINNFPSNSANSKIIKTKEKSLTFPQMLSKGFLGRRCQSFNSFRSFLNTTKSQLKRNGSVIHGGEDRQSRTNGTNSTISSCNIQGSKRHLKSIVKKCSFDNISNKSVISKRISFCDQVKVYPENYFQQLISEKGCSKIHYAPGLNIPSFSTLQNDTYSRNTLVENTEMSSEISSWVTNIHSTDSPLSIGYPIAMDSVLLKTQNPFSTRSNSCAIKANEDETRTFYTFKPPTIENSAEISKTISQIQQYGSISHNFPRPTGTIHTTLSTRLYNEMQIQNENGQIVSQFANNEGETSTSSSLQAASGRELLEALESELEEVLRSLEAETENF